MPHKLSEKLLEWAAYHAAYNEGKEPGDRLREGCTSMRDGSWIDFEQTLRETSAELDRLEGRVAELSERLKAATLCAEEAWGSAEEVEAEVARLRERAIPEGYYNTTWPPAAFKNENPFKWLCPPRHPGDVWTAVSDRATGVGITAEEALAALAAEEGASDDDADRG